MMMGCSMVEVERTHDMQLVKQAMTHPRVYPWLIDDTCPPADSFKPIDHPNIAYISVRVNGEPGGVFMFVQTNGCTMEVHTALLPNAWGATALEAQQKACGWVWDNTRAERIITQVPADNTLARRYAERAGFAVYGINPRSFLRNGQLHDIVLLGISRG